MIAPQDDTEGDALGFVLTLMAARQNILPRRLGDPGPTLAQVDALFQAAATAPDHGLILPWRFVVVSSDKRSLLADAFGQALLDRDAAATPEQVQAAREKAHRAPFLALAIARLGPAEPDIDPLERLVSLGAAIQNMLLCATSMGLGSSLTSGQAMRSESLRQLFGLAEAERAVCCINVGSVSRSKPARLRPSASQFVSHL